MGNDIITETIYIDTRGLDFIAVEELEEKLNKLIKEIGLNAVFRILKTSFRYLLPRGFFHEIAHGDKKAKCELDGFIEISASYHEREKEFWRV